MLLSYLSEIPETTLQLAPANNTINRRPVLLYQNQIAGSRIVITISDQHIRDSLRTPLKEVNYSLMVGKAILGLSGDVVTVNDTDQKFGQVGSKRYPFTIRYHLPPVFSLQRLISQGMGMLIFIFLMSCFAAYALIKYLNKNTTPEDALRRAILKGEVVPFTSPW